VNIATTAIRRASIVVWLVVVVVVAQIEVRIWMLFCFAEDVLLISFISHFSYGLFWWHLYVNPWWHAAGAFCAPCSATSVVA